MIPMRALSLVMSVAMLAALAPIAAAQDVPADPQGADWRLVEQRVEGSLTSVPLTVPASLALADGVANGSGGCNDFSGSYALDGASLSFADEMARTLRSCGPEAEAVEDAYLSVLADVASWTISEGQLELRDTFDETVLVFELPGDALTASQLAQLLARLDAADAAIAAVDTRVDDISIGRLRERLKALEAANARLQQQLSELRATPAPTQTSAFSSAERVLLEGVPARIAGTCQPLRQSLPSGTAAAVQCKPNTSHVTEMAYYLLEDDRALKLFNDRMASGGASPVDIYGPPGTPTCEDGVPSYLFADGGGIGGWGCFVDGGKANLRLVQNATACKQLKVGSQQLKRPAMYVAMTGPNDKIVPLNDWALGGKGVTKTIARPKAKKSPGAICP